MLVRVDARHSALTSKDGATKKGLHSDERRPFGIVSLPLGREGGLGGDKDKMRSWKSGSHEPKKFFTFPISI